MAIDKKVVSKLWERWWDRAGAGWVRVTAPEEPRVYGSRDAFIAGYKTALRHMDKDKKRP